MSKRAKQEDIVGHAIRVTDDQGRSQWWITRIADAGEAIAEVFSALGYPDDVSFEPFAATEADILICGLQKGVCLQNLGHTDWPPRKVAA
ncbi:hypothetical protein GCM10007874_39710 [Labrys miyagiensis]|uniref:Uncharacterized protein n=1 Tax=Labrys miyagiensis TaxID=346912 RepID=A0ABQ6CQH5_9HYPH|nr:hypothetical protein GCM10007874_39710 [Labrys miyagiensis]